MPFIIQKLQRRQQKPPALCPPGERAGVLRPLHRDRLGHICPCPSVFRVVRGSVALGNLKFTPIKAYLEASEKASEMRSLAHQLP